MKPGSRELRTQLKTLGYVILPVTWDIKHDSRVSHRYSSPWWTRCALQTFGWEASLFTRLEEAQIRLRCDGLLLLIRKRCREAGEACNWLQQSVLHLTFLLFPVFGTLFGGETSVHHLKNVFQEMWLLNNFQLSEPDVDWPLTISLTSWPVNKYIHSSANQIAAAHTPLWEETV